MSDLYPNPQWATGASDADLLEPTDEKRAAGWSFLDEPPHSTFNNLFNAWGEWAKNHGDYGAHYLDALTMWRLMDEGNVGELMPAYSGVAPSYGPPFSVLAAVSRGGTATTVRSFAIGGLYIDPIATRDESEESVIWGAAVVGRSGTDTVDILDHLSASILSTLAFTETVTTVLDVATNGRFVAVAHDDFLELFDCEDPRAPVFVYSYDHGAALAAVAIDQDQVYIAGASGTGSATLRAFNLVSSTPLASYDHGATVNGLAVDGVSVYIGGNAGTGGATVRRLERDVTTVLWSNPSASVVTGGQVFDSDGSEILSGDEIIEPQVGGVSGSVGAGVPTSMGLHPDYLFISGGTEVLWMRRAAQTAAAANALDVGGTVRCVACWGDRLWVGHDDTGSGTVITIVEMPEKKPQRLRRRTDTDDTLPYSRAVYPV